MWYIQLLAVLMRCQFTPHVCILCVCKETTMSIRSKALAAIKGTVKLSRKAAKGTVKHSVSAAKATKTFTKDSATDIAKDSCSAVKDGWTEDLNQ